MRRVADRLLWIGNAGDLRDARAVLGAGVEAVVELADSEQLAVLPRELVRCRFPLSDGGDNPALVCCAGGMSRSACIAAAGIALADGYSLGEALTMLAKSGPANVSPGLRIQVRNALSG